MEFAEVMAVHGDVAAVWVLAAHQGVNQGAFAGTGATDDGNPLAGLDGQRHSAKRVATVRGEQSSVRWIWLFSRPARVREPHVVELDTSAEPVRPDRSSGIARVGFRVQEFEEDVRRAQLGDDVTQEPADAVNPAGRDCGPREPGEHVANVGLASPYEPDACAEYADLGGGQDVVAQDRPVAVGEPDCHIGVVDAADTLIAFAQSPLFLCRELHELYVLNHVGTELVLAELQFPKGLHRIADDPVHGYRAKDKDDATRHQDSG